MFAVTIILNGPAHHIELHNISTNELEELKQRISAPANTYVDIVDYSGRNVRIFTSAIMLIASWREES